ncbi:hypothetical protein [Noviherbaspirillum sp. ST9]|uniref:hypothetical protein n=1 Tax=Noviherbaspirillum sp. ST9 TaxID=3401606 RepID=UPI003B586071
MFAVLLLLAGPAQADTSELDALSIADKAPSSESRQGRDWQLFVEAAAGHATQRMGAASAENTRLSLDFSLDKSLVPGWRAILANRIDVNWQNDPADQSSVNTLKEAYLSWQRTSDQIVDLGRINARHGVASGYNPTDFFKAGAVRSVVSADPNSLRRNRLGSVMLRAQTLWDSGSFSVLYSPKLATERSDAPFNADLGATNRQNRWLLAVTQQLAEGISPQWLLYGEDHRAPQLGFNLAALLNDATVAHVEWSGGQSRSMLSQALDGAEDKAFRSRLSTGLTYTLLTRISLTLEYAYNGAGLNRETWDALRRGPLPAYVQYRKVAADIQDLPTRQAVFMRASWQDFMTSHLDLIAMARVNLDDRSRMQWLEARYRWDKVDLAVQWQRNSGHAGSEYGALPQTQMTRLLVTWFF